MNLVANRNGKAAGIGASIYIYLNSLYSITMDIDRHLEVYALVSKLHKFLKLISLSRMRLSLESFIHQTLKSILSIASLSSKHSLDTINASFMAGQVSHLTHHYIPLETLLNKSFKGQMSLVSSWIKMITKRQKGCFSFSSS